MSAFAIKAREELLLGEKVKRCISNRCNRWSRKCCCNDFKSKLGYNVTAVTGKESNAEYLKSLGAKTVVNRAEFDKDPRLIR